MFGAKKVRPAWPLLWNALASVDITLAIDQMRLLGNKKVKQELKVLIQKKRNFKGRTQLYNVDRDNRKVSTC